MGITSTVGKGLLPHVSKAAPELSAHFVHEALRRAIDGVGPLPGAAVAADKVARCGAAATSTGRSTR